MNWQILGPMIHAAAREHLRSPSEDTRSKLATFVRMGNDAGNHTEWNSEDGTGNPDDQPTDDVSIGVVPDGMRDK